MEFEWDTDKAASNLSKHGVSFAEAMTVFGDPLEVMNCRPSPLGGGVPIRQYRSFWEAGRLLVVAYTKRDRRVRIISAREATPRERRQYESKG